MPSKYTAILLIVLISACSSPIFAGDLGSNQPVPSRETMKIRPILAANFAAYNWSPPEQQQSQALSTAGQRHWSKKGKVLTVVGLGLAALGGFMMTQEDQEMQTTMTSTGTQVTKLRMKVAGGLVLGTGAVIAIVGATRRE